MATVAWRTRNWAVEVMNWNQTPHHAKMSAILVQGDNWTIIIKSNIFLRLQDLMRKPTRPSSMVIADMCRHSQVGYQERVDLPHV